MLSACRLVHNDRLVRGLDYYTRTAFEFTHGALGAQNAILGGGRYDGLSESLGGPSAPGIGFAIGEDRLVLALQESAEAVQHKPDVYIAPLGAGMDREAARLARELRRHDLVVELGDENFRLKKSFETADKLGVRFALIVGENEVKAGSFALKNLETGEQVSVPRAELAGKDPGEVAEHLRTGGLMRNPVRFDCRSALLFFLSGRICAGSGEPRQASQPAGADADFEHQRGPRSPKKQERGFPETNVDRRFCLRGQ